MATLSLRLSDELLSEVDDQAVSLGIGRAEYIRRALMRMKADTEAGRLRKRLQDASLKVRSESMSVNAEFAAVETEPRA